MSRFETENLGVSRLSARRAPSTAGDERAESRVEIGLAKPGIPASPEGERRGAETGVEPSTKTPRKKRGRRCFTAEYKLEILRRIDACSERGEIGALLRREGLYHSHLAKWRRERERGALEALQAKRPGPKTAADKQLFDRLAQIEEEVRHLRYRLERAERRLAHRQQHSLHKTAGLVSRPMRDN